VIQQLAQLLGYNVNMVRMIATHFDDSIDSEMAGYENEMKDIRLLDKEQMGE
jgi:hypothetical protein